MPYDARIYRVLIASPGDVKEERDAVDDEMVNWARLRGESSGIHLAATRWETDVMPELGDRPQAIINRQIGDKSDVLIGVFWTRLGTPTGVAASGSIEEIERAVAAGKLVLLYFSRRPIAPDKIDQAQYKALETFKGECFKLGVVKAFETVDELRRLVAADLERVAQRLLALEKTRSQDAAKVAQDDAHIETCRQADVLKRLQGLEEKLATLAFASTGAPRQPGPSAADRPGIVQAIAAVADFGSSIRQNFTKALQRSHMAEARANLLAARVAYKAHFQEHDCYPTTFADAHFAPAAGARYVYFASAQEAVGGDGDNNRDELVRAGLAELVRQRIQPLSTKETFLIAAVGRGTSGATLDIWTIDPDGNLWHAGDDQGERAGYPANTGVERRSRSIDIRDSTVGGDVVGGNKTTTGSALGGR